MTSQASGIRELERLLEGDPENAEARLRLTHEYLRTQTGVVLFWSTSWTSILTLGILGMPPATEVRPPPIVYSTWAVPVTLDNFESGGDLRILRTHLGLPPDPDLSVRKTGWITAVLRSELDPINPRCPQLVVETRERMRAGPSGVTFPVLDELGRTLTPPHLVIVVSSGEYLTPPTGLRKSTHPLRLTAIEKDADAAPDVPTPAERLQINNLGPTLMGDGTLSDPGVGPGV